MQNTPVNYWCLDARLIFNMGSSVMYMCKKSKKNKDTLIVYAQILLIYLHLKCLTSALTLL